MNRSVLLAALFVSLILNVFVAGAFVGSRLKPERSDRPSIVQGPERRDRNPVTAAIRTLSPEAQTAWRVQTPAFLEANGTAMRETRRVSQAAIQGLSAEPFNAAVAAANLERARNLEYKNRLAMDRRLVAFAATLSAEDRASLARALARPRNVRGPRQAAAPAMD